MLRYFVKSVLSFLLIFLSISVIAQRYNNVSADTWVDSVFKTLSKDEKIAQLMVVRGSAMDAKTRRPVLFFKETQEVVKKYNIGGICMFQGGPRAQANFINHMQDIAKTPIL